MQRHQRKFNEIKNLLKEKLGEKIDVISENGNEIIEIKNSNFWLMVDKKREYISKIENNGSNLTLKTLFDIVEKGLGGKVRISIDV